MKLKSAITIAAALAMHATFISAGGPAASIKRAERSLRRRASSDSGSTESSRTTAVRINSSQPANIGFRVYEPTNERALETRRDDDYDDDTPRFDPPDFAIDFTIYDVNDADNICSVGCEGDYDAIHAALDQLLLDYSEEYELFFLVQGRYAIAAGVIYNDFEKRVKLLRKNHPNVDTIVMVNCPGSSNDDALVKGARLVHQYGYNTCVPSDGMVASGGTDMFVSGLERYATPGAKIGIHSWAGTHNGVETVGSDFPRDHWKHVMYLDLLEETCIPYDFYWQTLKSGLPMHWVTEGEIGSTFPYMRDCTPGDNTGGACEYSYDNICGCEDCPGKFRLKNKKKKKCSFIRGPVKKRNKRCSKKLKWGGRTFKNMCPVSCNAC